MLLQCDQSDSKTDQTVAASLLLAPAQLLDTLTLTVSSACQLSLLLLSSWHHGVLWRVMSPCWMLIFYSQGRILVLFPFSLTSKISFSWDVRVRKRNNFHQNCQEEISTWKLLLEWPLFGPHQDSFPLVWEAAGWFVLVEHPWHHAVPSATLPHILCSKVHHSPCASCFPEATA